nr:At1G76250-like protein [Tanacetum cinerariifolium]GFA15635.1 At1G76250-like protein [Tanacetum cinerariifolium]
MIPELDNAGLDELNSESAFQAQLKLRNVSHLTKRIPFCIFSDRTYNFPP